MSIKQHKPGENSQATLNRQGKHTKVKDKPATGASVDRVIIDEKPDYQAPVVDISMSKKELILAADALDLSTKGNKTELVERINNANK